MVNIIFAVLLLAVLALIVIESSSKVKFIIFCFLVYFMLDPGGFLTAYFSKGVLMGVSFIDIITVIIVILTFLDKNSARLFFKNRMAKNIFLSLLVFIIYRIIIWGIIASGYSYQDFLRLVIVRERVSLYSFLLLIPFYMFFIKNGFKMFYNIIIFSSIIIVALYFITIIFGINIIPVVAYKRELGSEVNRYLLWGYGLIFFLIPSSILIYLNKIKIKYKNINYTGATLALLLIFISLTKNLYIEVFGYFIAISFLSRLLLKYKISKTILMVSILSIVIIITTNIIFYEYIALAEKQVNNIFSLATTGIDTEGNMNRNWATPYIMAEIKENLFIGTGHGYMKFQNYDSIQAFDATDYPFLTHIMQYGVIGISIYLFYYYFLLKIIIRIIRQFKNLPRKTILDNFKYELIVSISVIGLFAGHFGKGFMIFYELTNEKLAIQFFIQTSILLVCSERIRIKYKQNYA